MSINTSGLPPYSEQDTKDLISRTVSARELEKRNKEKELKKLQIIANGLKQKVYK